MLRAGTAHARGALLIGLQPVPQFVQALEAYLGESGMVFYNGVEGGVIEIMLRPAAFVPRPEVQVGTDDSRETRFRSVIS